MIALYALIGKQAPTYVVIPGRKVIRDNIVCSMEGSSTSRRPRTSSMPPARRSR